MTTIDVLTTLCQLQENKDFRRRKATLNIQFEKKNTSTLMFKSSLFFDFITIECQLIQCIFCLDIENLSTKKRLWCFSNHANLKKHFFKKHLRYHENNQAIVCLHFLCEIILKNKMHLRNHAKMMHKSFIWSSRLRTKFFFFDFLKIFRCIFADYFQEISMRYWIWSIDCFVIIKF